MLPPPLACHAALMYCSARSRSPRLNSIQPLVSQMLYKNCAAAKSWKRRLSSLTSRSCVCNELIAASAYLSARSSCTFCSAREYAMFFQVSGLGDRLMADSSHFFHRHKFISLIAIPPDQIFRRNHRLRASRTQGAMSAIVHQDHVAAAHLPCDFLLDHRGGRSIPVIAGHVPHHRLQSEFTRDPDRGRSSSPKRWTKKIRMLADCVLQNLMAIDKLRARLRCRFEDEQRMRERVIADDMSRLRHRARNVGALLHVPADHEERRPHTVLRQHFQQLESMRIVRPVIVGQSDLLASPNSPSKRPPVPLAPPRPRLIPRRRSSSSGRQSNQSGEHEEILAGRRLSVVRCSSFATLSRPRTANDASRTTIDQRPTTSFR